MSEVHFPCGCSIWRSMFGEREVIWVHNCAEHSKDLQKELQALAQKIVEIQNYAVYEI